MKSILTLSKSPRKGGNVEHLNRAFLSSSHISVETNGVSNQVTWLISITDKEYK